MTTSLATVERWRDDLGLLPVPLYSISSDQFVLVNGTRGNFCLDLRPDSSLDGRVVAWSSNVFHYVAVGERTVDVHRWDRTALQRFRTADVEAGLERFHAYLEEEQADSSRSSIAHAIRVFRSLRGALRQRADGRQALQAFLCLMACASDDVRIADLDAAKWMLDTEAQEVASAVPDDSWEALRTDLLRGRSLEHLKLDLSLLIRHAGGTLFQEAHYEAIFTNQLGLFGPVPATVGASKIDQVYGLHFTPPPLARTLVEETVRLLRLSTEVTLFDPACGSGEFLREALRRLRIGGYPGNVRLLGWDLSPTACSMARFALAAEADTAAQISIECKDSVLSAWPDRLNAVLMNPPFLAWPDIPQRYKAELHRTLGANAGRPDLASAFVAKAAACLPEGATLATILPASFLDGTSMLALRKAIAEEINLVTVARLGSHDIFAGAKVDAGFLVGRKRVAGEVAEDPLVVWADSLSTSTSAALRGLRRMHRDRATTLQQLDTGHVSIYRRRLDPESWAPRPLAAWELQQRLASGDLPMVGELFDVRQGTLTGLNRAFLLTAAELETLPAREHAYFRPAVLNESIADGKLVRTSYVFYPYGARVIASESALQARVPHYFKKWLLPNRAVLKSRAGAPARWWELTRQRRWQVLPKAKIVSTYFGDAGSFAWDESGEYVVVQGYGWLPRSIKNVPRASWLSYLAILNSSTLSLLLSALSNHVGGGQWNLSKRFVSKLPMPDMAARHTEPSLVRALAEIGAAIHLQGTQSLTAEQRRRWDDLVHQAFGQDPL